MGEDVTGGVGVSVGWGHLSCSALNLKFFAVTPTIEHAGGIAEPMSVLMSSSSRQEA